VTPDILCTVRDENDALKSTALFIHAIFAEYTVLLIFFFFAQHKSSAQFTELMSPSCYLELSSAKLFQFSRLIIDGAVTGSELLMLSWDLVVLELRNPPLDCINTGVNFVHFNVSSIEMPSGS